MKLLVLLSLLPFALATAAFGADVAAGKVAYDASCKKCHGADGAANSAISKMLKVEMKHLGSAAVQAKSDALLTKEIVEGVGKMKAIPGAEKDIPNLLAFIRTFKQ